MSAADYYNPGGQQPGPGFSQPANSNHLNPNPPYPMSDAPPPYSVEPPRPHSQPPPQHRPPPPPHDQYWRAPPPPSGPSPINGHYPPEKSSRPTPQFETSDFTGPGSYAQRNGQKHPQYQQPQGYFPLAGSPAMQQVFGNGGADPNGRRPSTTPGYRPLASPYRDDYYRGTSRSRSRSRSRHRRHHYHDRPPTQRKKSSGVNTFLGAGGGAILGDAIFPGLGTLGGAILGGLGGHEYSKKKKSHSNPPSKMRDRSYSNDGEYYEDHRRGRKY